MTGVAQAVSETIVIPFLKKLAFAVSLRIVGLGILA